MINIIRTDSTHPDFIELVKLLDADLAKRDGEEHAFYAQFNKIDTIKNAIVAYENEIPIACGAFKLYEDTVVEIKRMFVIPAQRGKGTASKMLNELENWARELNFEACVLETGYNQPEAIALYKKNGYLITSNYGQYIGVANSICFKKYLS
ncbi:MAG: GNAT family N-acetyltransferase [Pelobium sp.]